MCLYLEITLTAAETILPFTFQCRQFPIRPAFSMTFNKCKGQTLGQIGVYLTSPVFSHSQLYVGLSCARTLNSITLLLSDLNFTDNIVYKTVLQKTTHELFSSLH